MKTRILAFTIALGASWSASSQTFERCPVRSEISKDGIFYTAKAFPNEAEGKWLGVAPDDADSIVRFFSATFYPAKDSDSGSAAVVNCSYDLTNGRTAILQFKPTPPPPNLGVNPSMWLRKHDLYGQNYFECTAVAGSGCSFYLVQRSHPAKPNPVEPFGRGEVGHVIPDTASH
ncbi:DUF3757 domain-containing protein [Paraburkholderia mimosarum]|uniref:DUF3757 domain-containing protein n=1 Tax=Paraburkholderia mimosarum TaxID=312026 RepID=UPI0009E095EB